MSHREAFVAAIAASPADDLPRLVFADWLEENGDPERAEFIRTQIRWHHATDAEEKQHLNRRAAELFRDHWQQWLRPFLLALDPHGRLDEWLTVGYTPHSGEEVALTLRRIEPATKSALTFVRVRRGMVAGVGVRVFGWPPTASLADAYRVEPPHVLNAELSDVGTRWHQFTHPTLRRVEHLGLSERVNADGPAAGAVAAFDDPHLAGVRQLTLSLYGHDNRYHIRRDVVPPVLTRFARSPLAYRLTGLELPTVNEDGVRGLCSSDRLHLERLSLGGELNTECVRRLERSGFGETVRELELSANLEDAGVAALARGGWRKLTRLKLSDNRLTAAVLPALAAAVFTPQLTELDLSENHLFFDQPADLNGLRVLAEVLDPDRLVHLNLTNTGLTAVPDFLAERLGDRVTV